MHIQVKDVLDLKFPLSETFQLSVYGLTKILYLLSRVYDSGFLRVNEFPLPINPVSGKYISQEQAACIWSTLDNAWRNEIYQREQKQLKEFPITVTQKALGVGTLTNPATGLLMTGGFDSLDTAGFRYGFDTHTVETKPGTECANTGKEYKAITFEERMAEIRRTKRPVTRPGIWKRFWAWCNMELGKGDVYSGMAGSRYGYSRSALFDDEDYVPSFGYGYRTSGFYHNSYSSYESRDTEYNPATGLPMVGDGIGGFDVGGSPYGSDSNDWHSSGFSSFND